MTSLTKRILSAVVLMPAFIVALFINDWFFYVVIALMAVVALKEWYDLVERDLTDKVTKDKKDFSRNLMIFGVFYIASFAFGLGRIFSSKLDGAELVLFVCAVVWATDIFAYFTGRAVGGPKLAPKISPNKTWAGLIGGIFGAVVIASILSMPQFKIDNFAGVSVYLIAFIGAVLALFDQIGDLMISAIKRYYGVKDTGNIIPGHGGLLDRIDGLMLSTIVFAIILFFMGGI